ncbi:MAG: biotin transporter BioY [Paracoccaceae bacterium]|nr:biotin transporter BioY [Paracoccaceae bacterium]
MTTRDMTFVALFAALTAACAVFPPVQVPVVPAPIIVQNIGVMLAGSILGARRGGLSLALFVVLVAVGMPILTGWRGGIGVILGPTGGFILSWIPAAFVVGWMVERFWKRLGFWTLLLSNVVGGIVVVYAIGIPWLAFVANADLGKTVVGSAVFIPGDVIKAIVASFAALIVKRSYPLIQR